MNNHLKAFSHSYLIWGLILLFCVRVGGQLIQVYFPAEVLPSLNRWQGSSIPYPLLLSFQVIIILLAAFAAVRLREGRVVPHRELGNTLLILGFIYFGVMLARLLLGLTVLSEYYWFNRTIPAFFHLVLAGILLTLGDYHRRYAGRL